MKRTKVLSLFDGMSCGHIALERSGIPVQEYHASEIDKWAIKVTEYNYPMTTHIGNVCNINPDDYKDTDLLIGGSPCQSISIAGKINGIKTNHGHVIDSLDKYMDLKKHGYTYDKSSPKFFTQSSLFWEYIRIYRGIKAHNPNVKFILENVVNKEWGELITNELGIEPHRINSSKIIPQNRDRYYWTNIPVDPIMDYELTLDDIILGALSGAGSRGVPQKNWTYSKDNPYKHKPVFTIRKDGLANCLTAGGGKSNRRYQTITGEIKDLTISECERLQTVPIGYTNVKGVSETQRFKMLGNGWTVDVMFHILKNYNQSFSTIGQEF